jgi:hypothetical protein
LIQQSTMTYLAFAAISKLVAVTATYPYQLMRTRMQDQYHEYKGAMDVLTRTWRSVAEILLTMHSMFNFNKFPM